MSDSRIRLRLAQIEVKRGIYPVGGATVRMYEVGVGQCYALPSHW